MDLSRPYASQRKAMAAKIQDATLLIEEGEHKTADWPSVRKYIENSIIPPLEQRRAQLWHAGSILTRQVATPSALTNFAHSWLNPPDGEEEGSASGALMRRGYATLRAMAQWPARRTRLHFETTRLARLPGITWRDRRAIGMRLHMVVIHVWLARHTIMKLITIVVVIAVVRLALRELSLLLPQLMAILKQFVEGLRIR